MTVKLPEPPEKVAEEIAKMIVTAMLTACVGLVLLCLYALPAMATLVAACMCFVVATICTLATIAIWVRDEQLRKALKGDPNGQKP